MSIEKHPYLSKEAPLEKLLTSLEDEHTKEELRDLVRTLSKNDQSISFEVNLPESGVPEVEPDFDTLTTKREGVGEDIQEQVTELIAWCRQYLRRPMITDTFPNHKARRDWFSTSYADAETMRKYLPFHQANKLRFNNISNFEQKILFLTLLLNSRSGVEWDKKEQLLSILKTFPNMEDYGELNDSTEKIARIAEIDAFCRSILKLFAKES